MSSRPGLSFTMSLYLGRQYLASIVFTTLAATTILLMGETLGMLDTIGSRPSVDGSMILRLVLLKVPDTLLMLVPFTIMIGTIVCFSRLSRTHELTAIRASGVSVWQFLLPPAFVCLMIGIFNLTILNTLSASTLKRYERLYSDLSPGSTKGILVEGGAMWIKQIDPDADLIIRSDRIKDQGAILNKVSIYRFSPDGEFIDLVDAEEMRLETGYWVVKNAKVLRTNKAAQNFKDMRIPTTLTLENIRSSFTSPNTVSVWDLPAFIRALHESGFSTLSHQMYLHQLIAAPFLGLAMFLLAVPFSLRLSRFGGVGQLIVVGIGFGFGFYLLSNIIGAYGLSGRLPLMIAAWLPVLIAGLLGIALLLHFREE